MKETMRSALVAIGSLMLAIPSVSVAEEAYQVTGNAAESIVKEGDVLTSQCEMGKETWWFCNILVKVTETTSSPKQGQGIWMCTYGLWPKFHKNGYGWFNPFKIRYQCIAGQKGV